VITNYRLNSINVKKTIVVFLGLVLVSSFVPLQSIYAASVTIPSTAINLSDFATDTSETPNIFSSGDNVYVVWREANDIRFVNSTDGGSTFPNTAIDIGNTGISSATGDPKIVVDGDNVYTVWREDSDIKFIPSNDNGENFAGAVVKVSSNTGTSSRDAQIDFSDSNSVHVVWRDRVAIEDNIILFSKSPDNGANFNSIIVIDADSDSQFPDPQIAASGTNVYVVWHDGTNILVAESTNNGNSFSSITDVGDTGGTDKESLPQITIDSGDNVYVVWDDGINLKAAIKKSGESFGAATTIGSIATGIPSQITTSGTNAYVVWRDNNDGSGDIKFAKSTGGAAFGSETNLSDNSGLSTLPQIAASGTNVFVAWRDLTTDSSGDIVIKASSDSGATFSSGSAQNVSDTSGDTSTEPTLSASGTKAYVSWKDIDPGNNDILFKTVTISSIGVSFDTTQYRLSETATITVTDAGSSGSVIVDVKSATTDPTTIPITLTETTPGTFTGTITFTESGSSSGTTLQASAGDTITATFGGADITASIFPKTIDFSGVTTFNLSSEANVRVIDQNANIDSGKAETVTVTISSTTNPTGITLVLTETGVDTGIFGGSSGDTQSDLIFTKGSGLVPIGSTKSITVTQTDFTGTAPTENSNADSNKIDEITVDITSTNGAAGTISLVLIETGIDTAVFSKDLLLSTVASDQSTGTLLIAPGDFITVTNQGAGFAFSKLLVTPAPSQDGALDVDTPFDANIKATYNPSITVTLNDPVAPGGGGGGLVSPGLVVNALGGVGGGGSSPATSLNNLLTSRVIDVPEEIKQIVFAHDSYTPLEPMDPDSFEGFDLPLVINDQGFVLGGFTNTLQTSTIKTDTPVTMTFTVYTGTKIQHFSMYMNLRDTNDSIPKSDTQILYNDGKELQVIDPNGFFSDAKITIVEEDDSVKKHVIVEMNFAKEMETSHIITRMWDPKLNSGDLHMLDAIKIVSAETKFNPSPELGEEIQVEELKSQTIPKWVKNNAEWWVDQQIGDEDFVSGIQYMVNNGIMYIPNTEPVNSSVTEIPDWIKTNAQWWVDNQISDDDFVKAMEWLVTNGVLRIE